MPTASAKRSVSPRTQAASESRTGSRIGALVFELSDGKPRASFGRIDAHGDNPASLDSPEAITARGDRAVVYDSGNQRLVKLRWVDVEPAVAGGNR